MSRIVEEFYLDRNVEESFKKFLGPDTGADDFQNLISSACPLINKSPVKFS